MIDVLNLHCLLIYCFNCWNSIAALRLSLKSQFQVIGFPFLRTRNVLKLLSLVNHTDSTDLVVTESCAKVLKYSIKKCTCVIFRGFWGVDMNNLREYKGFGFYLLQQTTSYLSLVIISGPQGFTFIC